MTGFVVLRLRPSGRRAWFGLAAIAALSLLPVYRRQTDTKLLLLTVPACAMLWAEGGLTGCLAVLVNIAGFALRGDFTWVFFLALINRLNLSTIGVSGQLLTAVQVFPVP